jgi:hypothetical protein
LPPVTRQAAVTDQNEAAADRSSAANPSQPAAAANNEPDPPPENIRDEFTSGGNTKKFIIKIFLGSTMWSVRVRDFVSRALIDNHCVVGKTRGSQC